MIASFFLLRSLYTLLLTLGATMVSAQPSPAVKQAEPRVGQEGKDVVWVPSTQEMVNIMLDLAKVTAGDYVIDLGAGDGRTVITAAKRGARGLGIEYEPQLVELAKRNAAKEGVAGKVAFVKADLFESDFSRATVITMYLWQDLNLKLRPKLLSLKPGTRIVSNLWTMGDWQEDGMATTDTAMKTGGRMYTYYRTVRRWLGDHYRALRQWVVPEKQVVDDYPYPPPGARLWIVPAKVEGTWRLAHGELTLRQSFQMVTGTLKADGNDFPIADGRLRGDELRFNAGGAAYSGRVGGSGIKGTVRTGSAVSDWSATLRPVIPASSAKRK